MTAEVNIVILAEGDNVGVAVRDIPAGDTACDIRGCEVATREAIPQGHKVALAEISADREIIRFGVPVGLATATIGIGHLVHVHNVASRYMNNDEDHYE